MDGRGLDKAIQDEPRLNQAAFLPGPFGRGLQYRRHGHHGTHVWSKDHQAHTAGPGTVVERRRRPLTAGNENTVEMTPQSCGSAAELRGIALAALRRLGMRAQHVDSALELRTAVRREQQICLYGVGLEEIV